MTHVDLSGPAQRRMARLPAAGAGLSNAAEASLEGRRRRRAESLVARSRRARP
jgi:hypothetical protein